MYIEVLPTMAVLFLYVGKMVWDKNERNVEFVGSVAKTLHELSKFKLCALYNPHVRFSLMSVF